MISGFITVVGGKVVIGTLGTCLALAAGLFGTGVAGRVVYDKLTEEK